MLINLTLENILLLGSILVFCSILISKTGYKFGMPALLMFLLVGMFFGSDGLGLQFGNAGQAQFISAGISEALITTEYGLVVAIPAYVAHAVFSRRAKSVLSDMEKLASSYLSGD